MTRDEYDRRIAALEARYPYLFAGEHIGRSVAPGWLPIMEELCDRIDGAIKEAERPRVSFVQIKEKFGGLRTYLSVAPIRLDAFSEGGEGFSGYIDEGCEPDLFSRLAPFVHEAERRSYETCLMCGAPGRLRRENRRWVLTLCDPHEPYGYDHLDSAWEILTDPALEITALAFDDIAARLTRSRGALRDLGAVHLGLLPPRRAGAPHRLVLSMAEDADNDAALATKRAAIALVGCPLNGVRHDWLRFEPDRPSHRSVTWIF